jgi:hypothetical protein
MCSCSDRFFSQIKVEREALDHVRDIYIDSSHIVFDLVPKPFAEFMEHCYTELGRPLVKRETVWDVYLHLLDMVQVNDEMIPPHIELLDEAEEDSTALPLLESHRDLPDREDGSGAYYMGGVGGGLGLGTPVLYFDANNTTRLISTQLMRIWISWRVLPVMTSLKSR